MALVDVLGSAPTGQGASSRRRLAHVSANAFLRGKNRFALTTTDLMRASLRASIVKSVQCSHYMEVRETQY